MADKVLTVSEQTHTLVNAWRAANGNMNQDFVVARALDALKDKPNGLVAPGATPEPSQNAATSP